MSPIRSQFHRPFGLLLLLVAFVIFSVLDVNAEHNDRALFRLQPHHMNGSALHVTTKRPVSFDHVSRLLHRDLQRMLITTASANPDTFPLGGTADPNIAGLYFTEIQLGTPPSTYYVQVDTGSDLLWVNCALCKTCPTSTSLGFRLALYDPRLSSTSKSVMCGDSYCAADPSTGCQTQDVCFYQLGYGDGSSSQGYFVRDALQLSMVAGNKSRTTNATIAFGCATSQGGQNSDQALDGIIGFGQSNLSVFSQLVNQKLASGVFTHCLEGQSGSGGGILVIGEVQAPGLVYTPIIPNQPHYNVNLKSINVKGVTISVDSSISENGSTGTIIDSGTTLAYFSDPIYNQLRQAILNSLQPGAVSFEWEGMTCLTLTGSVDDAFPSVTFTFEGDNATMTSVPHDYLIRVDGQSGTAWCIGFQSPGSNTLSLNILGDLLLKDKLVVYDLRQPQPRIGWVNYDCTTNVSVLSSTGQIEYVMASSIPMASIGSNGSHVEYRFSLLIICLLSLMIANKIII